jgi:hypothetical protein
MQTSQISVPATAKDRAATAQPRLNLSDRVLGTGALERAINLALIALLAVSLLMIYGLIPYRHINSLAITLIAVGQGESMALSGFHGYLPHMGYPMGSPVVFGLPFTIIHAALISLFSMEAYAAYIVTSILFMTVAAGGCVALLRSLRISMPVALVFSLLFFATRFVWGHSDYGQLLFNFALLPTYLLLDKMLLNRLYQPGGSRWTLAAVIALSAGARVFSLFMDGYTFVMWSVASGIIYLFYGAGSLRARRIAPFALSLLVLGASGAAAYVLYGRYVPGGDTYAVMPIDFFRAMSVDVMTLFVPTRPPFALSWLGLPEQFYDSTPFYGDGSNVNLNYLGISLIAALIAYLLFRRSKPPFERALLVAGLIAFILSLGPSLKINSQRAEPKQPGEPALWEDYLMPEDEALLSLGTDFIYTQIPGINNMRAVYRWLLLPKLVLIIAAAVLAEQLRRQRRYALLALLIGAAAVEFTPPIPERVYEHETYYREMRQIDHDLIEPLREYIQPGERILFFSDENDFLASYIAPMLDAYSYNVGGDKNLQIAFDQWPDGVRAVRWEIHVTEYVTQMLQDNELDWFIIPFFSLRWDSYRWPPTEATRQYFRHHRSALFNLNDPNFTIIESEYFYLIRLNDELREAFGLV